MIVVDSLALSKMLTNDIVVPILLRNRSRDIYRASLRSMRLCILLVVFLGYGWASLAAGRFLLVEMGLLSFVAVTQCAPGDPARARLAAGQPARRVRGHLCRLRPLVLHADRPRAGEGGRPRARRSWSRARSGMEWLRPTAPLSASTGLDSLSHGLFWSLLANLGAYVLVSLATRQDAEERLQAAAFTGRFPGAAMPIDRSDPHAAGDRAHRPPLRGRPRGGRHRGGDPRHQGAGRPHASRAPRASDPPREAPGRLAGRGRRALHRGGPLHALDRARRSVSWSRSRSSGTPCGRPRRRLGATSACWRASCGASTTASSPRTPAGRLVTVNPAGERLFGAAQAELAGAHRGGSSWSRGPGCPRGHAGRALERRLRVEGRGPGADPRASRVLPATWPWLPIFDPGGQVLGTVGVLRT